MEGPPDPRLVLLERFATVTQAELARLQLRDAGIESVLVTEPGDGGAPGDGTVLCAEVRVAPEDLDVAFRVLRASTGSDEAPEP